MKNSKIWDSLVHASKALAASQNLLNKDVGDNRARLHKHLVFMKENLLPKDRARVEFPDVDAYSKYVANKEEESDLVVMVDGSFQDGTAAWAVCVWSRRGIPFRVKIGSRAGCSAFDAEAEALFQALQYVMKEYPTQSAVFFSDCQNLTQGIYNQTLLAINEDTMVDLPKLLEAIRESSARIRYVEREYNAVANYFAFCAAKKQFQDWVYDLNEQVGEGDEETEKGEAAESQLGGKGAGTDKGEAVPTEAGWQEKEDGAESGKEDGEGQAATEERVTENSEGTEKGAAGLAVVGSQERKKEEAGPIEAGWQVKDAAESVKEEAGAIEAGWQEKEDGDESVKEDGEGRAATEERVTAAGWQEKEDGAESVKEAGPIDAGWQEKEDGDESVKEDGEGPAATEERVTAAGWQEKEDGAESVKEEAGSIEAGWQEKEDGAESVKGAGPVKEGAGPIEAGWQEKKDGDESVKEDGEGRAATEERVTAADGHERNKGEADSAERREV